MFRIENAPYTTPFDFLFVISICIPMWGTTRTATFKPTDNHFNPRSRVGNDCKPDNGANKTMISIHVPAWGTTGADGKSSYTWIFQSTFPRGERREIWDNSHSDCSEFQSTFPRGERRERMVHRVFREHQISIHVPAWGTTVVHSTYLDLGIISIHVPAWGTTDTPPILKANGEFQSTFPRGERR